MEKSTRVELNGKVLPLLEEYKEAAKNIVNALNGVGFREVAIAYMEMPGASDLPVYEVKDESDLILLGVLSFLDPPKDSAAEALQHLHNLSIDAKILTGDNEMITAFICQNVGIPVEKILLGPQSEIMTESELSQAVNSTSIFAKFAPNHKEKIIRAIQKNCHVVGFMGDGINDAPALKASDVGISVDSAVDIAKESSDIILLDNNLLVLEQCVMVGRRIFGNIIKYIKMAASSNFATCSASWELVRSCPCCPSRSSQTICFPDDDPHGCHRCRLAKKPRQWKISGIQKFILFIGPISSIFDYLTFFIMLYVFDCWNNPALFHTGWFVESIFTQTLIIHVIRPNKIPFIESRASIPLLLSSLAIVIVGIWLPVSPLAETLGFVALPGLYWVFLAMMMIGYILLTQVIKTWFIRKYGE